MALGPHKRAQDLMNQGLRAVRSGLVNEAKQHFRASAEAYPTAEATTYWGWMEHQVGNTGLAIELCKRAIELDPDFGNPYNDIGSYLISLGELDEAIRWLKKAMLSPRYEARHYPHLNLAQIFTLKGMPMKALRELKLAQEIAPQDATITQRIEQLKSTIC